MTVNPLRYVIVGMNGYSRVHINSVLDLQRGHPDVRLEAVSTRRRGVDAAYEQKLLDQGVRIDATLDDLLAADPPPDVLCVPTSIDLHVPMTLAGLERGCAVVVEKPVAATVQEVDTLIRARDRTGRPVVVGFQHLSQNRYWNIKRLLCDGLIGPVREVHGMAASPRYVSYYARAGWAGKMRVNDAWVLDSPFNNACAHYLLQGLFYADPEYASTARPVQVAAELYRGQPIDGPDTACLDIVTRDGVRVLFVVSHAIEESFGPETTVIGDHGRLIVKMSELWLEKNGERTRLDEAPVTGCPFSAIRRLLRGETDVPHCSLEMARPQTVVINGAHLSSPVRPLPPEAVMVKDIPKSDKHPAGDRQYGITGLYPAMQQVYTDGIPLHQTGQLPWTVPADPVDVSELTVFDGPRMI